MMTRTTMHPLKILAAVGVAFLVWGLVLAFASSPAWAAEITVNTTADEQNTDGTCSLREAIEAAHTDTAVDGCAAGTGEDTIVFDLGSSATITLDSMLGQLPPITDADGLTIDGGDAEIAVSGGDQVRVLSVSGGARLDLENLTVSDGRNATDGFAGGIYNDGGTLNVTDSTFSGNIAAHGGGGIYNNGGRLTVTGSTFSGNGAVVGGGLFNANTPGGATVINSTFSGNTASNSGGAISNQLGGSSLDVTGSTFSGNSAGLFGGAIFGGPLTGTTFRNSVFANNPATRDGSCSASTTLDGRIINGGYNIDEGTTCGFTDPTSQSNTNPLLGPLQDNGGPTNTHALRKGSPALDQGNSFGTTTDQRGESRPHDFADIDNAPGGDGSDIGAFEAQVLPNEAPTVEGDSYSTNEETPLTVAAPGVLGNDSDSDSGDTLTAERVSGPSHGTLSLNADGSFTYTPNANFSGSDSFTYKANDSSADSDPATVSIEVTAANDAPSASVAQGGSCGSASDMRGTINLALLDPDDPPPESLTLTATSSNRSVLPNRNISFGGGADASRTMTVSSLTGSGTSNVTITVSDGDQEGTVVVRVISGSADKNTLTGGANADMIFARKGSDTLSAQGANDLMCGGNGNDRLTGGPGADHFAGGSGTDTATDFDSGEGDTSKGIP